MCSVGLVSLTEMKAKQEDIVKERERHIAINKGEAARLEVEEVNRRKAEKKKQKQVGPNIDSTHQNSSAPMAVSRLS